MQGLGFRVWQFLPFKYALGITGIFFMNDVRHFKKWNTLKTMGICRALPHRCLHVPLSNHFWWFKKTHLQTIKCKNSNPKHRKYETTQNVQMKNYENIKKLQNKKHDVLKSQIIKSDLKSNTKKIEHVHTKINL